MAAPISLARWMALGFSLLLVWGTGDRAWAGPRVRGSNPQPINWCPKDCTPRAATFGHYEATWRRWPGEARPDQHFPQSIGAEVLPTPKGLEHVPLPLDSSVPEVPEVPGPQAPEPTAVPPGGILPPGEIEIEGRSPLDETPTMPLPLEDPAEGPAPLPGIPLESPPIDRLPGLPLEPTTPSLPDGSGAVPPADPDAQEAMPIPVEPWVEPRPWQPEPALPATFQPTTRPQAPLQDLPQHQWNPPFETPEEPPAPLADGPGDPEAARMLGRLFGRTAVPLADTVPSPDTEQPTAPPAEGPVAVPAEQPATPLTEGPVAPPAEQATTPLVEQPAAPSVERPQASLAEGPIAPPAEQPATPPVEQPAAPLAKLPAVAPVEPPLDPIPERPALAEPDEPLAPVASQPGQRRFEQMEVPKFEQPLTPIPAKPAERSFPQPAVRAFEPPIAPVAAKPVAPVSEQPVDWGPEEASLPIADPPLASPVAEMPVDRGFEPAPVARFEQPAAPVEEQPLASPVAEMPVDRGFEPVPVARFEQPIAPVTEQPVDRGPETPGQLTYEPPVAEQPIVAPMEEAPVEPVEAQPIAVPFDEPVAAPFKEPVAVPFEEAAAVPMEEAPVERSYEQAVAVPMEEAPVAPVVEQAVERRFERPLGSPFGDPAAPPVVEQAADRRFERPLGSPFAGPPARRVGEAVEARFEQPLGMPVEGPVEARFDQPQEAAPLPGAISSILPAVAELPPRINGPVGLDGYCPVKLAEEEAWVEGDPRWPVRHAGSTYLMSSLQRQQRFLADPLRYAPVMGGFDPVKIADENTHVAGQTEFCAVYQGRLYTFSNAATLARFHQSPKRYSAIVAGAGNR